MSGPQFLDVDTLGNLKPISQVVISLGSNQGESLRIMQAAVNLLAETPSVMPVEVSSVYLTKPVDVEDQPDFYNMVMLADTTLEPLTLLERCQSIEDYFGRVRTDPKGPRTLDVDLIMVGKRVSDTEHLVLPHPQAHRRAFVLVPWLEVEPEAQLIGHGKVRDLLATMDTSGVVRIDEVIELP